MGTTQRQHEQRLSDARHGRIADGQLTADGVRPQGTSAHRQPVDQTFQVVRQRANTAPRGFVLYVHVRPDKSYRAWVCDECLHSVQPSQFMTHAEDNH